MGTTKDLSVLYVEDEPLARWTGAKMIAPLVGRLVATASCAEAESSWTREKFDLIISDYRLEDGLASEMVARMRRAGHQTPVICLSGESEDLIPADAGSPEYFSQVLSKPLDLDLLRKVLIEMFEASPLSVTAPALRSVSPAALLPVCARVTPLWVAPEWDLAGAGGAARPYFELAAGRKGGLWILLYDCVAAHDGEMCSAERIALMFRQLAGWLPAAAAADRMLARCYDGLHRLIDTDYDWALAVLRLHGGRATFARGLDTRAWNVWLQDTAQQWTLLTDWSAGVHPRPLVACLVAHGTGGGVEKTPEALCVDATRAGGIHGFCLRACPARRLIKLPIAQLADPAAAFDLLQSLEHSLATDGLPPLTLRRLACGLLDLAVKVGSAVSAALADSAAGALTVEWKTDSVTVALPELAAISDVGENRFFDAVTATDGVTRLSLAAHPVNDAFDAMPVVQRAGRADALADDTGLYSVEKLPPVLTGGLARALSGRLRDRDRLALDGGDLKFVDQESLLILRKMAATRRLAAGNLCLLGCTPLMERLMRWAGVDRDIDLAADRADLEVLARRLTSASERASILESVVKW